MDKNLYHKSLKSMHEAGVSMDYYHGWASGALGNPPLEEQRVTAEYTAGYEDGTGGVTDAYDKWIVKSA